MGKIDYIASDVHLGAVPPETERIFVGFLDRAGQDAGTMLINGDLFDFWFEYGEVIPGKHFRVLAAMSERAGDRAAFRARIATLGDDRYATAREEVPLAAGNTLDCYSAPLYGADGTHYGRVWYFRDISAQKRSAALERETSPDGSARVPRARDIRRATSPWHQSAPRAGTCTGNRPA